MKLNIINNLNEVNESIVIIPFSEDNFLSKSVLGAKKFNEIQRFINNFNEKLPDIFSLSVSGELIIMFKIKADELSEFYLLKTGKQLSDFIKKFKFNSVTILPLENLLKNYKGNYTKYLIEGIFFGLYEFDEFKSEKKNEKFENINLFAGNKTLTEKFNNLKNELPVIFKYVNLCRDLVNLPPSKLTPEVFVEKLKALKHKNIEAEIYDVQKIKDHDFNLIYEVGKGSKNPPYFVKLRYNGNSSSDKHIALVGKGVTFDSGGTNLKPSGHIETMKMDMAGAALMLSVTLLAAELDLPVNIYTYLPLVENILGQNSYKPGDIIKSASGKTVEILNTDAEGRLILADALYEASKANPELIIDAATLTGACIIALGGYCAGLFSNDVKLSHQFMNLSQKTGENIWQLPLLKIYESRIKGQNADLCNIAKQKGEAGSTTAALFLKEFIGDSKWIHLDIAGPAYINDSHPIFGSGASGFGVRLLLEFFKLKN